MPLICRQCSRTNPNDAEFCHFDGFALVQRTGAAGPVNVGQQPFISPLVLASGRQCRNFNELALACHDKPGEALELLKHGFLANFLGNIGRMDLALAARQAAQAPDPRLGLDQFLGRLPGEVLKEPKLGVSPLEINLGQLQVGEDRHFSITLSNLGMRLVHGSINTAGTWLFVGDGPGVKQKLFQFEHELTIPVHVRGKNLRGSKKPLEETIQLESNGGRVKVVVRAQVPVKPFGEGLFRGFTSPRQVAEKTKALPREAAPLFASGAVARWYRANGWNYPASEPFPSGVAAVQQFFEAHQLSRPPKVDLNTLALSLQGRVGDVVMAELRASTKEKRYIWVQALAKDSWLQVGEIRHDGANATIPIVIPSVPGRPGESYRSWVMVTTNGNRKFAVAVNLTVTGVTAAATMTPAQAGTYAPARPPVLEALPAAPMPTAYQAGTPGGPAWLANAPPTAAFAHSGMPPAAAFAPATAQRQRRSGLAHLVPLGILGLLLLVAVVRDLFVKGNGLAASGGGELGLIDSRPRLACYFHDAEEQVMLGDGGVKPPRGFLPQQGTPAVWEPSMRFGLVMLGDFSGGRKRLTFEEKGFTNNVVVRLDGNEWIFGEKPFRLRDGRYAGTNLGRWKQRDQELGYDADGRKRLGKKSTWIYDDERVEVTQTVEIVAGAQSRLLDTCLVRYAIENHDRARHSVGLRFMLDTFIGGNDGVPFTIPGKDQLCDTQQEFNRPEEVPDFIQALENQSLTNPGTIAQIQLRLGRLESPSRVTLGTWPNPALRDRDRRCMQEKTLWEVPLLPIHTNNPSDSAVVIYWNERDLAPGDKREVGFAYGLGTVASGEGGGQLAVTIGGSFAPGGEFTVTALVRDPTPGQTVTLTLPDGFRLSSGSLSQPVPPLAGGASRTSPVTWKVKSGREGKYTLRVQTSNGLSQTQPVTIRTSRIFD